MISSNFLWGIGWRVIMMTLFIIGSIHTIYKSPFVVTPIMLGLLAMIVLVSLILHLEKIHKGWSKFLLSIAYQDFSTASGDNSDFPLLKESYDLISRTFQELNTGRQGEKHFSQTVYEHIPIGLISYDTEGELLFVNSAFNQLFAFGSISHINKLAIDHGAIHLFLNKPWGENESELFEFENQKVLVKRESLELGGRPLQIASFHDIKSTLDANEEESYQKLLRVLTHEIMNSATPILSLTRIVNGKLINGDRLNNLNDKDEKNIATSLRAIEERTLGITRFVEGYKQINKDFSPIRKHIFMETFIDDLTILVPQDKVELQVLNQVNGLANFDLDLITQVLLNLIKNAYEAVSGDGSGSVQCHVKMKDGTALIFEVIDNGPGIHDDIGTHVFIPFFSTKQGGSGIGLALSRKIVRSHGGNIRYSRVEGATHFLVELPNAIVASEDTNAL